jgi:non-ribosomal peptide synthetase component F
MAGQSGLKPVSCQELIWQTSEKANRTIKELRKKRIIKDMENNLLTLDHRFKELLSQDEAQLAADPLASIPDVGSGPLVGSQQFSKAAEDWWDTSLNECIHELFERQVKRTPEATAVVFGDEQLSYFELNRRANQLAHYLRDRGVGAEIPVGICLERSVEMVVGILGVLKAGGCYVPLEPEYPPKRLSLILGDSGVRLLLTQQELTGKLPPHAAGVVRLDADWDEIGGSAETNLGAVATPANLVYMIYTSGSTGQPKGVMIPHRALGNHSTGSSHPENTLQLRRLSVGAFRATARGGATGDDCSGRTSGRSLPGELHRRAEDYGSKNSPFVT